MPTKSKFPIIRAAWPRIVDYRTTKLRSFVVDGRYNGNGHRHYSRSVAKAKALAERLAIERDNHGTALLNFPAEDRVMAVESRELLRPFGKTIREATLHYVAWLKSEAIRSQSPLVKDCVAQFLADRERASQRGDLAKRSLDEIRHRMVCLTSATAGMHIVDLGVEQLKAFLDSFPVSTRTRSNIRRIVSVFLNYCCDNRWIDRNPCERIRIKVPRTDVVVLSVADAERLLRSAEASKFADVLVPYVALCLFGGLRPFEAQGLEWSNVDFETNHLHVLAHTSKKRESRFVQMEPALVEWLRPYSRTNRKRICGANFRRQWESLLKDSGYSAQRPWPQDAMRHTAASMLLAVKQNRALVAEELGTSVDVLRRHYRQPILKSVATTFWDLRPSRSS